MAGGSHVPQHLFKLLVYFCPFVQVEYMIVYRAVSSVKALLNIVYGKDVSPLSKHIHFFVIQKNIYTMLRPKIAMYSKNTAFPFILMAPLVWFCRGLTASKEYRPLWAVFMSDNPLNLIPFKLMFNLLTSTCSNVPTLLQLEGYLNMSLPFLNS